MVINNACKKDKQVWKYRQYGYIYNKLDSMPFGNTQFKIYVYRAYYLVTPSKTEEFYFNTNSNGFFDITTEINGDLVWPSYSQGAAYVGPREFGAPINSNQDMQKKQWTSNYDTLYTTPYH